MKIIFFIPLRIIFPFRLIGKARLPKKRTYVTVTNHLAARDVIILGLYLPGFRYFLAKKELAKRRFIRFWLRMFGAVYIDRQGLDLRGIKECINCLKNAPLAIFPEGTRNNVSEEIQEVKGGAAMIAVKAGVDVVPVIIHHRLKAFRRNFIYVGEKVELPYAKNDRFNTEAMSVCTALMTESMGESKATLCRLVAEKGWRKYNRELKRKKKAERKWEKEKGEI